MGKRQLHVHIGLEVNADDSDARIRTGLQVLNIIHGGGHRAFADQHDALFHVIRKHAGVSPDHADNRNVDRGENVNRHGKDRADSEDGNQHRHHHKSVGPLKSDTDQPHHFSISSPPPQEVTWL
ncbi:MAG: hypothetical protein WBR26_18780 [Candidatus Acidiferrum sp.]